MRVSATLQSYPTDIPVLDHALREIAAAPEGAARHEFDERGDHPPRERRGAQPWAGRRVPNGAS